MAAALSAAQATINRLQRQLGQIPDGGSEALERRGHIQARCNGQKLV